MPPAAFRMFVTKDRKLARALRRLPREVRTVFGSVEREQAQHTLADLRSVLGQAGHGRLYRIGGRYHQASAPGEAPAPFSGSYRRSWKMVQLAEGYAVFTEDPRAPMLEFGTRTMLPRPHAGVVYERQKKAFLKRTAAAGPTLETRLR